MTLEQVIYKIFLGNTEPKHNANATLGRTYTRLGLGLKAALAPPVLLHGHLK